MSHDFVPQESGTRCAACSQHKDAAIHKIDPRATKAPVSEKDPGGMAWDSKPSSRAQQAVADVLLHGPIFTAGDLVQKHGGNYGGPGQIVAVFETSEGETSYVVAFKIEGGHGEFFHILTEKQLTEC